MSILKTNLSENPSHEPDMYAACTSEVVDHSFKVYLTNTDLWKSKFTTLTMPLMVVKSHMYALSKLTFRSLSLLKKSELPLGCEKRGENVGVGVDDAAGPPVLKGRDLDDGGPVGG